MEKLESIVVGAIILLIVIVFIAISVSGDGNANLHNSAANGIIRNLKSTDVIGLYSVKKDKNSKLQLNDDGTYNLNLNICDGYLELSGVYEVRDKNLYLINRVSYEDYPNLTNNEEFHFNIVDDNTIELEEDLVCLYGETLFEK